MKKIFFVLILLLIYISINNVISIKAFQKPVISNIKNDDFLITLIGLDNFKSILMSNLNTNIILIIDYIDDGNSGLKDIIKLLGIKKIDYLITFNNEVIPIDYKRKLNIEYEFTFDNNITINKENEVIEIDYNNYRLCVLSKNTYLDNCNFLYLVDTSEDFYVSIDDNVVDAIFYHESEELSKKFKLELYSKWIDTYIIKNNELSTIRIFDDEYEISSVPYK